MIDRPGPGCGLPTWCVYTGFPPAFSQADMGQHMDIGVTVELIFTQCAKVVYVEMFRSLSYPPSVAAFASHAEAGHEDTAFLSFPSVLDLLFWNTVLFGS